MNFQRQKLNTVDIARLLTDYVKMERALAARATLGDGQNAPDAEFV